MTGGFQPSKVIGINSLEVRCPYVHEIGHALSMTEVYEDSFLMSLNADSIHWYQKWYRFSMGMNLRLPDAMAANLRSLAEETGKSQQVLIREAIEMYLRDYKLQAYPPEIRHAITPATTSFEEALMELKKQGPLPSSQSLLATLEEMRKDRM